MGLENGQKGGVGKSFFMTNCVYEEGGRIWENDRGAFKGKEKKRKK